MQTQIPQSPEIQPQAPKTQESVVAPASPELRVSQAQEAPRQQTEGFSQATLSAQAPTEVVQITPVADEETKDVPVADRNYVASVGAIVETNTGDPFAMEEAAQKLGQRYIKERFNKDIPLDKAA